MTTQHRAGVTSKTVATVGALLLATVLTASCTGGSESHAASEQTPPREAPAAEQQAVNAKQQLETISPAIPIYSGAEFRSDLTKRDEVMVRSRYGAGAQVYTMATDDSFPQVYHFYTTYLAQFRGFDSRDRYPNEGKNWRTLEVQLNQAMQDPFIPGDTMNAGGRQVMLQIAETEAEPHTVIRYIVMPAGAVPPTTAIAQNGAAPPPGVSAVAAQPAAAPAAANMPEGGEEVAVTPGVTTPSR